MTLIGATPIAQVSARPDQVHLRLLATSDLHAHLLPYDYFTARRASGIGLARLADLIAQAREDAPNSMLFDNGDTLQGTPLADTALVRILPSGGTNPMITAMNALGFDAGTLGNHDFDFGLDYLETSLDAADFPVTLANVHRPDGTPFQAQRLMLKRPVSDGAGGTHTLRVGVTGALPPQVAAWSRRIVEGRLVFEDITTTVAAQVAALRADGADIVVVLAHSGLGHAKPCHGAENVARHLATLDGVDAVVAGHTHDLAALEAGPGMAPVVQPAAYGTHLGVIDMVLDPPNGANHWDVDVAQAANLAAPVLPRRQGGALRRLLARFPALRRELAHAHRTTRAHVDSPLGQSAVWLETLFSTIAPCAATQLVADAQRSVAKPLVAARPDLADLPLLSAAAPFRAGGRAGPANYTVIPPGPLKLRHAADLYIYPNALCVLRIDGAGLLDWLERSASIYHQIDPSAEAPQKLINHSFAPYNFDRITGLRYRIDVSQPARTDAEGWNINPDASRIRDLCFADGRPVRPHDQALIVTNSYRASGGGHMPSAAAAETILTSSGSVRDAVARHIASAKGPIYPRIDPTFEFLPLGGADVLFETGASATHQTTRLAQLGLRPAVPSPDELGYARFLLTL